jgi:hypothetical protein
LFDPNCWDRLDSETKERYTVKPEDEDKAAAALYWAQELAADVGNDYLWNVRVVSYRERVSYREAGIAASIISAYNRAMEKETAARYERDNPSQYFGTVGERSVYDVKVLSRKELIGEYGVTTLVVFRMADGNRAKLFASGEAEDFPLDAEVKVKATVKGHEEYRGAKQTVLSRVAVYVEKAKKELGWTPKYDLATGLKDSYDKDFGRGTFREAADFTADDMVLAAKRK